MVLACDWASLKWGSKSTGNLRKSQMHSRQTSNTMPLKTGQSLHPLADWCLPIGQVQRRNSSLQSLSHMTQMHILMSKATSSHSSHAVYLPSVQVDMPNAGHNTTLLVLFQVLPELQHSQSFTRQQHSRSPFHYLKIDDCIFQCVASISSRKSHKSNSLYNPNSG